MAKLSAGLLLWRRHEDEVQVLLVHPGGPVWAKKDEGAWSIPKGEHEPDDDPLATAVREFGEELGTAPPETVDPDLDLGEVRLASGKRVRAFARAGDLDVTTITSNEFEVEWPPRSGKRQRFPEVDRAGWFPLPAARTKLNAAQVAFVDRLGDALG